MIDVKVHLPSGVFADGEIADGQDLRQPHIMVQFKNTDRVITEHPIPVHSSRIYFLPKEES